MGFEHRPCKSCNCNCSLDQPGMGGQSPWKKKGPDLLWAAMSGLVTLVFYPSLSWRPESFKKKNVLFRHINGLAPEIKELAEPIFYLGFNQGSHINKMGTYGFNLCGSVSSSSWNGLYCWVVELMILICRSIGYKNQWDLIWASVPYYFSVPPGEAELFSSPSSDHPQLVIILEYVVWGNTGVFLEFCNIFA